VVRLEINGSQYLFPQSWEELTPEQFKRVCGFLLQSWTPALQYTLFRLLLPIEPKVFAQMADWQILNLLPLVDFLQKPIIPKPVRVFRIGFRGFWLPDRMKLRAVDYTVSEPLLKQFVKTGKEEYLDMLVASLCRPRKLWIVFFGWFRVFNLNWDGDPREKFHSEISNIRKAKISKVPLHLKMMVVYWLIQIRWDIFKTYKPVFSGGEGDGDWNAAMMELAERSLFGNLQETYQSNFYLILKFLKKEKEKNRKK
jgi:hypothetical protein